MSTRQTCNLLAVLCGKLAARRKEEVWYHSEYPIPELVSAGRLEVQTLVNPTVDEFREAQRSLSPNLLYFQGELNDEEIGNLVWGSIDVSDPDTFSSLIGPSIPTIVYMEVPNSGGIAQALLSKGVPYVIYWKNVFTLYAASHFRHTLLSVIQSSYSHIWDAFQLAHASFRLYCVRNNHVVPANGQQLSAKLGPRLLGDAPKINIPAPEKPSLEEEQESSESLLSIQIHEDDLNMGILVCGVSGTLDACLLGSIEDGLSALLNIEIRGSRLHNRVSATPPPLQAANFSRDVVTMRCDLVTCSSAHITLLVSGSAQICFNDELLECHIKNELIEKGQLVHALPISEEKKSSQPMNSLAVACGASTFEVLTKLPNWAAQVLKQLAPVLSYRSLVALGVASIHGISVASFEKEDADRLLFFSRKQGRENPSLEPVYHMLPFRCPSPRKRSSSSQENGTTYDGTAANNGASWMINHDDQNERMPLRATCIPSFPNRQKFKVASMRPIPHTRPRTMLPFTAVSATDVYGGSHVKPVLPVALKHVPPVPPPARKSSSNSLRSRQTVPLNPLPMKKHGCNRPLIRVCSEEEFLTDVIEFLIHRGHSRLVPQGGLSEFPDAILNGKRLDLYNLYSEVVSRGGFYVGNGINWKGQVFSKMRNHTACNKMTGVGNTLKRHYETYLLEYELAHDDVDGECCLLCHSSTPGDWVNCGLCGEWAHFGCDRRQGLASFKDYAKTDGLEYICPHCSVKRKSQKTVNGFSHSSTVSHHV